MRLQPEGLQLDVTLGLVAELVVLEDIVHLPDSDHEDGTAAKDSILPKVAEVEGHDCSGSEDALGLVELLEELDDCNEVFGGGGSGIYGGCCGGEVLLLVVLLFLVVVVANEGRRGGAADLHVGVSHRQRPEEPAQPLDIAAFLEGLAHGGDLRKNIIVVVVNKLMA